MFVIFIFWICFAFLVGLVGRDREIGFGASLFLAILLSPLIGLVITLFSDKKKTIVHRYKDAVDLARLHEFKEEYKEAMNSYKNALFYLDNDYPNPHNNSEIQYQVATRKNEIKMAISELEFKMNSANK